MKVTGKTTGLLAVFMLLVSGSSWASNTQMTAIPNEETNKCYFLVVSELREYFGSFCKNSQCSHLKLKDQQEVIDQVQKIVSLYFSKPQDILDSNTVAKVYFDKVFKILLYEYSLTESDAKKIVYKLYRKYTSDFKKMHEPCKRYIRPGSNRSNSP